MTDFADPEEVILYDLDHEASVDELIALTRDPERRWFAKARLAALGARGGIVAANWNPLLHPRGKDGKFIQVWGFIRWLGLDGKWRRGQVTSIEPNGDIIVKRIGEGIGPETTHFKHHQAQKLTGMPNPKAKIDLPDPTNPKGGSVKWEKIGGQGGSNPGGKYKAGVLYGGPGSLDGGAFYQILANHGLTDGMPPDFNAVGRVPGAPSKIVYRDHDGKITAATGTTYNPPPDTVWFSSVDHESVERAWAEMKAAAAAVNDGDEWYVKKAKSTDHARIEVLANRLYEATGVNVPSTQLGLAAPFLASQIQTDVVGTKEDLGDRLGDPDILDKVKEDFAVDAWLANWDVVGLDYENIQIIDDVPYRIDAGGALTYRAQGAPKGAMFGPTVGEIESLTDPSINAQASKTFGGVTEEQIRDGVERIAALSPEGIKALVDEIGVDESVSDTLIARRQFLLDKYGIEDPWGYEDPDEVAAEFANESITPTSVTPGFSGPHQWDTESQDWTGDSAYPPSSPYSQLEALYDSNNFQLFKGAELWQQGLSQRILWQGRLVFAKPDATNENWFSAEDVLDGTPSIFYAPPLEDVWVATAEPTVLHNTYKALMDGLRSSRVSQDANRTVDDLFSSPGLDKEPVGPGLPEMPKFRSFNLFSSDPVDPGQYIYDDGGDKKLWRATTGKPAGFTTEIAVTDPFTGATTTIMYGGLYSPTKDDHGYSTEVLNAITKDGEYAKLDALLAEEEAIEANKIAAAEAVLGPMMDAPLADDEEWVESPPEPEGGASPDLPYAVAWKAMKASMKNAGPSFTIFDESAIKNKFADEFGKIADIGDGQTIQKSKLDAFLALNGLDLDKSNFYLASAHPTLGLHDPEAEEPDPPSKQDVNVPPTPIDNVNAGLQAHKVEFDTATLDNLVGKVVLIKNADYLIEGQTDESAVVKQKHGGYLSVGKSVNTLAFVTSVDTNSGALNFVDSAGRESYMTKASVPYVEVYEVDNATAEDMKLSLKPVFKANGDIVHGGVVIGEWEKSEGLGYWDKPSWRYTVFAQHSILGKTTTGSATKKGNAVIFANRVAMLKPVAVKSKKSSTTTKKVADLVAAPPELEGATYSDGTTAKLGDWVQSTKGGGGFIGKIVGWPSQEHAPGLVFAVSNDGVQKAVKLKTQKKVSGPTEDPPIGTPFIDNVPSAYTGLTLADGNVPVVGMKVSAGKPGGAQTEGIVTNINPSQGWVYILTPDGKTVSKTFSVTKVTGAPELYWDLPAPAAVAVADSLTPKKAAPGTVLYPTDEGETIFQAPSVQEEWLAGNPGRKLSKDGYAPLVGMRVVTSKGDKAVVYQLPSEWANSAINSVKIYNLSTGKLSSTTWSTASVDHTAELTGMGGAKPFVFGNVQLAGQSEGLSYPAGTPIYRMKMQQSKYIEGKYRTFTDWIYFAVTGPDSTDLYHIPTWSGEGIAQKNSGTFTWGVAKSHAPSEIEKVGIFIPGEQKTLSITPFKSPYGEFVHSDVKLLDDTGVPQPFIEVPVGDGGTALVEAEMVPIPDDSGGTVDIPLPKTPEVPAVEEETDTEVATPESVAETGVVEPPAVVPQSSITTFVPPPSETKIKKVSYPTPPQITAPEPIDLSQQNDRLTAAGAKNIRDAASEMITLKDSKEPNSGTRYAVGDSDVIEDMLFRYSIETVNGQDRLVLRFRLREDLSEDALALMVTSGEAQTGAWKIHSSVFPHQLEAGDAVSIRIASGSKLLKPTEGAPNARVVGEPLLLGKTDESGFDVYRVKVQTDDGAIGEVDMQHRPSSSILTYEWDPDAIPENTGKVLSLTPTAAEVGWKRHGKMSFPGTYPSVMVNDQGKFDAQGLVFDKMAKGSGGHWLSRSLPHNGKITFNAAHKAESGTGFDTTRRSNAAGEVRISFPITDETLTDGSFESAIMPEISRAMELVGVSPEKQQPPSDEHLVRFALQKLVTNYHPTYKYRDKLVTGPEDPRVTETLAHMSSKLKGHLGRDVTLDDLRIHTHTTGRIQIMLSPEVGIAMGKLQGNSHYQHSGAQHLGFQLLGSTLNGVMGADERWSLGILNKNLSGDEDQRIGSGDRIYTYGRSHKGQATNGLVIFNPMMVNTGTEVYTNKNNDSDAYGRRGSTNKFLESSSGAEVMYKRKYEPEMISYYLTESRDSLIAQLKAAGITHIGGRPVEEIVITSSMFKNLDDISQVGIEFFADDIPITDLISGVATAATPAAAPVAAGAGS